MSKEEVRKYLDDIVSHVIFDYNNKACGVDPISPMHYDMWYGEENIMAKSIEEVFTLPLFDNKSLDEIFSYITNLE